MEIKNKHGSEEENITANLVEDEAKKIAEDEYGLVATNIKRLDGYDDLNFHLSPPLITKNEFHEAQLCPLGYMLKIINARDSKNEQFFHEYINVLLHLNKENFPCPRPVLNKDGKYLGCWIDFGQTLSLELAKNLDSRKHIFLLLTFLQGEILERFKYSQRVDISLGHLLSQMHTKLKPFCDAQGLHRPNFMWALHSAPNVVENLIHVIIDKEKQSLILKVIAEFKETVIPNLDSMDRGVIHGDLNLGNVLVQSSVSGAEFFDIVGVIDFTDMHSSYFIYDLALTACYISLHDVDHYEEKIASLLLGYNKVLSDLEMLLLKICICTRLCQSIVIGMHTLSINPNNEYVKNSASLKYGWKLLERLLKISHVEFNKLMRLKIEHFKGVSSVAKK